MLRKGGARRRLAAPDLPAMFVTDLIIKYHKPDSTGTKDWGFPLLGAREKAMRLV